MTAIYRKELTLLFGSLAFSFTPVLHAGTPVWTLTPLTATSIVVPSNGCATVQYLVTNQSAKSHRLVMRPMAGITQRTSGEGVCSNPLTLPTKGSSCTLSLLVKGSQLTHPITEGPIVCEQGSSFECYQPSPSNSLKINIDQPLSASVSTLALSVNNPGLNPALTGTPRLITITNTGTSYAANVTYTVSPALPSGTTISPSRCGKIAPSGSCVLTVTPGSTPSAAPGETTPTPIALNISGLNTNIVTVNLDVLTYGSIYQGGYLYAVNDTTPNTGSIGGKVVALSDQAPAYPNGVVWGSNGESTGLYKVSNDIIPGIDNSSTTATPEPTYVDAVNLFDDTYDNAPVPYTFPSSDSFSACNGGTDGACNSANISTLYNTYITHYDTTDLLAPGPTTSSYYAAGLCTGTINGYSDWYLPAICEMGPASNGSGCSNTQNMVSQLPGLVGDACAYGTNCLSGFYWSSTLSSGFPSTTAWYQFFASVSDQSTDIKSEDLGVRCSRALTY